MTVYQWLCVLGIPGLFTALVGVFISLAKQIKAVKAGTQAMLRAQMIASYNEWNAKRYAPLYARDNFNNLWKQYEALGENGVMNDLYKRFMALPTDKGGTHK